jgi:crotonobetainyl-CoA:carnitine CoA-transferase CaiB-like acyl-CoA transferase
MRQDPFRYTVDTNIGKRSAFIDLNSELDQQTIRRLIVGADVMVQSWRPGSLKKKGIGPEEAAVIRPGIIYVSVSAFGDAGPWRTRGGFEQLGQVVSGIASEEGGADRPKLVPTYMLNDYLTGYLGAVGAMLALIRRAREGGSYHVKLSLARTSMWVQSLGLENEIDPKVQGRHFSDNLNPLLEKRNSVYGVLEQLPPVAQFSRTKAYWSLPPVPIGADEPVWLSD